MGKLRLDKYLADMGQGTRTEVKKRIKKGSVTVDGEVIKAPEFKVDIQKARVCVSGQAVGYEEFFYYMLHKPAGVVSASRDNRDKTVLDLLKGEPCRALFPVGRLDKDTEGLLLLTNDGALAHNLLSPKKHVEKTYFVRAQKPLAEEDVKKLEAGVDIGEEKPTLPARVTGVSEAQTEFCLTIREGKFHQIKRMLQAVDNEVVYLKRLSMGSLHLDAALLPGAYRRLTKEEIEGLKNNVGTDKSGDF